jgi:crossover junction endodeoxyribonuclease RuvC
MKILGIDPGLRLTGYGVIAAAGVKPALIDGGVIRLDTKSSIPDRLVELERELQAIVAEHSPDVCAVEQLYSNYAHPRTAILMGHARGVIMLVARRNKMEIREFAANRVKQATVGHGHAAKGQMQRAIQAIWSLPALPEPPAVADALAVALCCANSMLHGKTSSVPLPRRRSSTALLRAMGTSSMPRTVPVRL